MSTQWAVSIVEATIEEFIDSKLDTFSFNVEAVAVKNLEELHTTLNDLIKLKHEINTALYFKQVITSELWDQTESEAP